MPDTDVIIIGAGLAGLACARRLHQSNIAFQVLEASDAVGGRVRTDVIDGFRLDRGFQVYLPAYPEGIRVLDYEQLQLRPFRRGAIVRFGGRFHQVSDPMERPFQAAFSLINPIGSLRDKLRIGLLKTELQSRSLDKIINDKEQLILDDLRGRYHFSPKIIERFFRPWLGGIFLDRNLTTSSRFFRFVFAMFAKGGAAIPELGMSAIPDQLAISLPKDAIRLNTAVRKIEPSRVFLADNSSMTARAIVVACDPGTAAQLLNGAIDRPGMTGTTTLYFSADRSPVPEPMLVLNGEGRGRINNLVVLSEVSKSYAPEGKALISVSVLGVPNNSENLQNEVFQELKDWYGDAVNSWRFLRNYQIPDALPTQSAGHLEQWQRPVRIRPGLYVCGDHRDQASIDGALTSGFRTAQVVAEDLYNQTA